VPLYPGGVAVRLQYLRYHIYVVVVQMIFNDLGILLLRRLHELLWELRRASCSTP